MALDERALMLLVEQQANDPLLWQPPETPTESALQRALRALHHLVETSAKEIVRDRTLLVAWDRLSARTRADLNASTEGSIIKIVSRELPYIKKIEQAVAESDPRAVAAPTGR